VLLLNHATREGNRWFDPKIDDTLEFNANIRRVLLERHPGIDPRNVLQAWFGRREVNPALPRRPPAFSQLERTRAMRGENLGEAYLYETDELPQGDAGLLYWDALERLKAQGVEHIVVAFPQIMVDSVLNLVEVPNQVAKEIGWRGWARLDPGDFATWPGTGHPFADYWGNWVDTDCPARQRRGREPCCFTMGGCDGRAALPAAAAHADRTGRATISTRHWRSTSRTTGTWATTRPWARRVRRARCRRSTGAAGTSGSRRTRTRASRPSSPTR
jgi:hypothetical protein